MHKVTDNSLLISPYLESPIVNQLLETANKYSLHQAADRVPKTNY